MDTRQLALITDETSESRSWKLDEHTRQIGRQGIAAARRALRQALARQQHGADPAHAADETHTPHAA